MLLKLCIDKTLQEIGQCATTHHVRLQDIHTEMRHHVNPKLKVHVK